MMIRVVYKNGIHDTVVPEYLNFLLESDRIKMFRRSSGWVHVGVDPIRNQIAPSYNGPERRTASSSPSDIFTVSH
ncbi:MAG: hypothetical protein A2X84_05020 [Desulfuromonadaceae bacterium GWC2_58_13]|nr:MAG: hypothetical protein A2X84_05020 [Desulfuromonadaceae bacterium GWC2_58_13]